MRLAHLLHLLFHGFADAFEFDQEHRRRVHRVARMSGLFDHAQHDPVEHFHCNRRDGASGNLRHGAAGILAGFVDGEDGLDHFRLTHQADNHFGDQHHGALAAGEKAGEIVTRKIGPLAAGFHDASVGQHEFQAEHVIGGDAVGEGVRASCVFGDIAADGAGALAGGVGCKEVAAALDGERDIQIDDARLHHRALVFEVQFEDSIHAGEGDHETALARNGSSGESGAGAAADKRDAEFLRQFDEPGDFGGVARKGYQVGSVFIDAAVVFVKCQILRPVEVSARSE